MKKLQRAPLCIFPILAGDTGTYVYDQSSRGKAKRQIYHRDQTRVLEQEFQRNRYIQRKDRAALHMTLGLSERQIKIWFQNRRMKDKKLQQEQDSKSPTASSANSVHSLSHLPSHSESAISSSSQSQPGSVVPLKRSEYHQELMMSRGNIKPDRKTEVPKNQWNYPQ